MDKFSKIFSDNLKRLMKDNDMTVSDLHQKLKSQGQPISQITIYKWISGDIYPRPDKIAALCKIFDVSESMLRGEYNKSILPAHDIIKKSYRLLGNVACGEPIYADEDREAFVMADSDIDADFCLVCKGDSMIDCGINDGDIVFVKSQSQVNNGEIAVVLIDDEATLKRVIYDEKSKTITLIPQNKKYLPKVYTEEDGKNIRILGKAIFYQSLIK